MAWCLLIDELSEDEVAELNIPIGIHLVYKLDQDLNVLDSRRSLS